jgi:AAA+ ATPase superfamily predicted ATPase
MTIRFVNRKEELKRLENIGGVNIVFGRRRVGKTALVKHFLDGKNAVYLLAVNKPLPFNLRRFSEEFSRIYEIPGLNFSNFKEMFQFIETREQEIIIIDEFGYLIQHGILPEFQEIVDEISSKKLVLTGSSISLMETEVMNYKSPIYGRVDTIMHLQPFKFSHLIEWFSGKRFEDIFRIYAAVGGTPRYLEFFKANRPIEEIKKNFFTQSFLFYDARMIIEDELRETTRYFMILEAIAKGKNTLNDIRNFTGMEYNKISFYVNKLKRLKILSLKKPLLLPKRSFYSINDNYFHFWFRFVYPFEDYIDSMMSENAIFEFDRDFNTYLGPVFEDISMQVIRKKFGFPKIGSQFGTIPANLRKDPSETSYEIDIAALNEENDILFAECKWSDRIDARRIAKKLEEKASYVRWKTNERKESYAVFARSFYKKIDEWNGKRVYCFDIKDIEEILTQG